MSWKISLFPWCWSSFSTFAMDTEIQKLLWCRSDSFLVSTTDDHLKLFSPECRQCSCNSSHHLRVVLYKFIEYICTYLNAVVSNPGVLGFTRIIVTFITIVGITPMMLCPMAILHSSWGYLMIRLHCWVDFFTSCPLCNIMSCMEDNEWALQLPCWLLSGPMCHWAGYSS